MLVPVLLVVLVLVLVYCLLHLTVLKLPRCQSSARLDGKTAVVTGANTGIGKATAMDLARRGARVILACRDRQRAEAAARDIIQETGNTQVVYMHLDLASLKSVRSFSENFLRSEARLDLLINNAGLMNGGKTKDGFGMIFGVNHLGHFLLTALLLERLKESGPSRVLTVSSNTADLGSLDFECLQRHKDLALGDGDLTLFRKYSHSKLCNILFTYELAKRLQGSDVTCYSIHPGVIKTEIARYSGFWFGLLVRPIMFLFFVDVDSGAQTTLHCALQPGLEPLSGQFFSHCRPATMWLANMRDDAAARKLWDLSEFFCGI